MLALEYLRFADGLDRVEREREVYEHRQKVLETIVRGSLVASGEYEEKTIFSEYFDDEASDGAGDAGAEFDYSGVEFEVPDESEMEILARMLADDSVTVDGAPIEGPGAEQVSPPDDPPKSDLPPPRELDITELEQDPEWI